MRLARRLGAFSFAAVMLSGTAAPAEARAAKDFVRYADGSCPGKKFGVQHLCAPWQLKLRSGRVIRLTDARMFADPKDKRSGRTGFALTPHGSQVAYFRLKDDALVIRDVGTGKVRVVPGVKWSSTNRFMFSLSPAARFIVIKREPYQVLDSVTGQAHTLPAGQVVLGFSPDNRYLLVSQRGGGFAVCSTATWGLVRTGARVGPHSVLQANGTTIAYTDWDPRGKKPEYVRFLDLATGGPAGSPMKIPTGERPNGLLWDQANHLDLLTRRTTEDGVIWRWRRANDGMRVLDTFLIRSSEMSVDDEIDIIGGVLDYS
jgi:hypothetical protein